jgi:hypothetical protein
LGKAVAEQSDNDFVRLRSLTVIDLQADFLPKWAASSGLSLLIETVLPLIKLFSFKGVRSVLICS